MWMLTWNKWQKQHGLGMLLGLILILGLAACGDEGSDDPRGATGNGDLAETAPLVSGNDDSGSNSTSDSEDSGDNGGGGQPSSDTGGAAVDPPTGDKPEGQTWLIMLYQDADDETLELDIFLDANEAELIGSQDRVHIVAQMDRFDGAFDGDGDWQGAKRFYVEQDDDLWTMGSTEVMDLGEVNMASGAALVDFVTWAAAEYPADKHVLILSDHGAGWPGGWSDPEPGPAGAEAQTIALGQNNGDQLFLMEMDEALGEIRAQTGIDKFELVGFDACLMGHIEVFAAMAPHARYAVASQESEPAMGWAYAAFLEELVNDPDIGGAELASAIVETYLDGDIKSEGDLEGLSANQRTMTLAAVDLEQMPTVLAALDELSVALSQAPAQPIAKARRYARSFSGYFDERPPYNYIDLVHFAQVAKEETGDAAVGQAADLLTTAAAGAMVVERHGVDQEGAAGFSVYFPNSDLFQAVDSGHESYTAVANRFAEDSLWDEFLVAYYSGEALTAPEDGGEVAPPPVAETILAPGESEITVSELSVSADVATIDAPVVVEATISGDAAFVYFFVGSYLEDEEALLITTMDFVQADANKEIGGVLYPDWGDEESFALDYEWEPLDFLLAEENGPNSAFALFYPQEYGHTFEVTTYSVEGIYTFADSGNQRYATMHFLGDDLLSVYGYTDPNSATGAPREITVTPGDTFTVLDWLLPLADEEEDYELEGATLTLGEDVIIASNEPAPAGDYVIGFLVEDFDGNLYESFAGVIVADGGVEDSSEEVAGGGGAASEAEVQTVSDVSGLFQLDLPVDWQVSAEENLVLAAPDLESWWAGYVLQGEGETSDAAGIYLSVDDFGAGLSREDMVEFLEQQPGPSNCELSEEQISYEWVSYENVANVYSCEDDGIYIILFGYDEVAPTYRIWFEGYQATDAELDALEWALGSLAFE